MAPGEGVERSLVLPVSPSELWNTLTRPERLSAWFGAKVVELELWPGGRIVFREPGATIRRGLIQTVDPPRCFAFRWLPVVEGPDGAMDPVARTTVEFVLEEAEEGTRLTVTESTAPAQGAAGPLHRAIAWVR
jgi:uncharacterized protein YndB with AHSA1/START domain